MAEEYYHPWELTFARHQMLWLLKNLAVLQGGHYPEDPYSSGYSDTRRSTSFPSHAPWQSAIELLAEIERRRVLTGIDGELLLSQAQQGLTIIELHNMARMALNYMSVWDWRKRTQSYGLWKAVRLFRQRKRNKNIA